MTVMLRFGSDQTDPKRPRSKLWSVAGKQSEDWLETNILINLVDNKIPFQIEIRPSEILDSRGHMYLDDFRFINCGESRVFLS